MDIDKYWQNYLATIETYLKGLNFGSGILNESMHYSLSGGGKRLRPVLVLAAAYAVGGSQDRFDVFLPGAAALELIHTYSLIHDDLPAMDNDDYRRGKPANHIKYGEAQAILAGDALLTHAFELLSQPLPIPAERQLRVIGEVARAAGEKGMVAGQVADIVSEGKTLTLAEIESIHLLKTGALLKAAVRIGGILGGGNEAQIEALTRYGQAVGLAFQIKDDILDIEGDTQTLGKPAGSDLKQQKATYPAILGLEGAKAHLTQRTKEAKAALAGFGQEGEFLRRLADHVAERQY